MEYSCGSGDIFIYFTVSYRVIMLLPCDRCCVFLLTNCAFLWRNISREIATAPTYVLVNYLYVFCCMTVYIHKVCF